MEARSCERHIWIGIDWNLHDFIWCDGADWFERNNMDDLAGDLEVQVQVEIGILLEKQSHTTIHKYIVCQRRRTWNSSTATTTTTTTTTTATTTQNRMERRANSAHNPLGLSSAELKRFQVTDWPDGAKIMAGFVALSVFICRREKAQGRGGKWDLAEALRAASQLNRFGLPLALASANKHIVWE